MTEARYQALKNRTSMLANGVLKRAQDIALYGSDPERAWKYWKAAERLRNWGQNYEN